MPAGERSAEHGALLREEEVGPCGDEDDLQAQPERCRCRVHVVERPCERHLARCVEHQRYNRSPPQSRGERASPPSPEDDGEPEQRAEAVAPAVGPDVDARGEVGDEQGDAAPADEGQQDGHDPQPRPRMADPLIRRMRHAPEPSFRPTPSSSPSLFTSPRNGAKRTRTATLACKASAYQLSYRPELRPDRADASIQRKRWRVFPSATVPDG